MKPPPPQFLRWLLIVLFAGFIGCKKEAVKEDSQQQLVDRNNLHQRASYNIGNDEDSVLTPMVLGNQMINPYLVLNMKRAYQNITGQNSTPAITHKYVRFLPSDFMQMHQLDSIAKTQDFELFDYPLDYELLSDGDYYHDPYVPGDQITWQYAVVAPNFSAPSGITYQVLASIHIPSNSLVEQEAERLAGLNADGDASLSGGGVARNSGDKKDKKKNTANNPPPPEPCEEGFEWDDASLSCIPIPNPPDPVFTPGGRIMVFDTRLDDPNTNVAQPLRRVRLVAYRWFKIEKIYTDNQGNFHFNKSFRRKVKFRAKFENEFCTIRGLREASALASFFVVQKQIGVFSGNDLNNVNYIFRRTGGKQSNGLRRWAAATILNGVQEHRDYAAQLNFNTAPQDLNIYITPHTTSASTPLFQKRYLTTVPTDFLREYVASNFVQFTSIFSVFSTAANLDMTIGYGNTNLESDALKETVYHEMSHASHYSLAGVSWYNEFVASLVYEITANLGSNGVSPYGAGTDAYSPIIALGEGWAYFMGHFLADRRYGVSASCTSEQTDALGFGIPFCPNPPTLTIHPHIDVLEFFDPNLQTDPFRWIPQGLFEDMIDETNEKRLTGGAVDDNISGYTIMMMINALESNVKSPQQFRDRVIQQTGANQALVNLFSEYNYN